MSGRGAKRAATWASTAWNNLWLAYVKIAIKTLCAEHGKLITAIIGVAFSVALVNVQTGLYSGLMRKAGLMVDYSPGGYLGRPQADAQCRFSAQHILAAGCTA